MIEIKDGMRYVRTKLVIDISTTFNDDEATEETIKYCVNEDLSSFDVHDVSLYNATSTEKMEQQHKILQKAIATYGKENQIIKAMEEMDELIQALARGFGVDESTDDGKKLISNVREETADVLVMIMQLIDIFGMDVYGYFDQKIERLERRLEQYKPPELDDTTKETLDRLKDLIEDRKSFLTGEDNHDEIYITDIEALENALRMIQETKQ